MKPKTFSRFREFAPGAIRPRGHVEEFLRRQRSGMTGHFKKLGYPFDTTMWTKKIAAAHFTEGIHHGETRPVPRADGVWWPYEQSGYLLDGMLRLSFLVDAPELRAVYEKNLRALLAAAAPDGHLGGNLHDTGSEWPMAVFFKSVIAYVDAFGAPDVVAAFARHYASLSEKRKGWWGRDLLNVEGTLKIYELTGDKSLLADALETYKWSYDYKRFRTQRRIHEHGVSFAESLKLPAILHRYTGDETWLRLGERAVDAAFAEHEQPSGQLSANEFLSGRDPRQAYETCVTSDMLWSLGYYAQAGGARAVAAADRMEKIAYNALPGAVKKDFTGHQYLSAVNQVCATPFSNNSHYNFAESVWRQYRCGHFPECCSGNVNRAMPIFAGRMWLREEATGAPCAMLLGPSELSATYRGRAFRIEERTDYPFEDVVRFVVRLEGGAAAEPLAMPLLFRVPTWARGATLALDGEPLPGRPAPGTIARVERAWRDGDELSLSLSAAVRLRTDRHWHWFERGALAFAYPVPARITPEKPGDRFSPISVEPAGPWNFALDLAAVRKARPALERRESAYPFETPACVLRVPVAEIAEWRALDQNRFTPDVPLYAHPTGETRTIELVPFGATLARVAAFPDTEPREPLPILAAYASDAYDYDPAKPLRKQVFEPESWNDDTFRSRPIPQRTPEQFFDLGGHFGVKADEKKLAYLLFRFWSDRAGTATAALGAANTAQVFLDGKEIFALTGLHEGEEMAPQWFPLPVRKGHNYLLVKVATPGKQGQYRREWGAKLDVFFPSPAASK